MEYNVPVQWTTNRLRELAFGNDVSANNDDNTTKWDDVKPNDVETSKSGDVISCSLCLSDLKNVSWCDDCCKIVCSTCLIPHNAIFSDHVVTQVPPEDSYTKKFGMKFCNLHKTEKIDFFCEKCALTLCVKCLMSNHKDHPTSELSQYEGVARNELKNVKENLQKKRIELEKFVSDVKISINKMMESLGDCSRKIDRQLARIQDVAMAKGRQLQQEMDVVRKEEKRKKDKLIDETLNMINQMTKIEESITLVLDGPSRYDIVDAVLPMKAKEKEMTTHALPTIFDVTSSFFPGEINQKKIERTVGNIQIQLGPIFKYDFRKNDLNKAWTYSRSFKLQIWPCYIRAKKSAENNIHLGVLVYIGEDIDPCTIQMSLEVRDNQNTQTKEFIQTFTPPLGELIWQNALSLTSNTPATLNATSLTSNTPVPANSFSFSSNTAETQKALSFSSNTPVPPNAFSFSSNTPVPPNAVGVSLSKDDKDDVSLSIDDDDIITVKLKCIVTG